MKQRNLADVVARKKFVVTGHGPSPLSALLYQCLFNGSLTSGDFLRLFRETVMEINSSTKRMMVQPKYVENTKENRINTQSLETSCQKEPAELELLHSDRMAHYAHEVHVSPADVSTFPQSIESVCSFSGSPSPLAAGRRQEETSDKQPGSLTYMPAKADTQYCSDLTLSVGDAPEAMLVKSSSRESVGELFIFENPAESHMVDVTQTEDRKGP
ncbi:uncharacterized protein LOC128535761 [Clarias gariepinus]|uniref:uncharacterized protein LOC128535761 n=1 Tax=Clarias gariepinus TaxID=13013 RepID=UPI00234D9C0A|nr:uncharacterized protein LOC128535761 [Clarias gariepinus]